MKWHWAMLLTCAIQAGATLGYGVLEAIDPRGRDLYTIGVGCVAAIALYRTFHRSWRPDKAGGE